LQEGDLIVGKDIYGRLPHEAYSWNAVHLPGRTGESSPSGNQYD